jgi:predicted nucleic acid-binding protein
MPYLIDTNVLSELRRGRKCETNVRRWAEGIDAQEIFISVLSLGEIRAGVEAWRLRDPKQAAVIERWLLALSRRYAKRISQRNRARGGSLGSAVAQATASRRRRIDCGDRPRGLSVTPEAG